MRQTRRALWLVLCAILLYAFAGGAHGQRLEATSSGGDDPDIQSNLNAFTRIYELVEQNYAEPVDPDRAIYGPPETNQGTIPGMLRTLDPHSIFFDPRAFAKLREDQEGRYFGVGMQIGPRPGKVGKIVTMVVLPMPGSPAFRAGLRPGDIIIRVDGKSTDGLDTTQVAALLKGPKGTVVHVVVDREGSEQPLEFAITREEISRRSVDAAFLIRPGVAYIHILNFNETTDEELKDALKKLSVKTLEGMILDLRGNPGGLLQEAVDVADHFLGKSQLIVYHNGRHSHEKRYYASKGDANYDYPMIALVNRLTASAAEILAGALQDHDRALVMGEPSFGKGLVQTVFPLSEHTGLALTTARYFTPAGRLIQRDYLDVSLYDYYYHFEQSLPPRGEVRLTDGGREVYGGGGIAPDVKISEPKLTPTQEMLAQRSAFFNFGKFYFASRRTVPADFVPGDEVLQEFRQFLADKKIPVSDQDFKDNQEFIKNHIRWQLVDVVYGEYEAARVGAESDYVVAKALEHLGEARELLAHAKRYVASKSASR